VNKERKFLKFHSHQTKGVQYFVVLDNLDHFTVLERNLSFKTLIKSHSDQTTQSQPQITSFLRQGSALIFTRQNKVEFLHVAEGRLGPVTCSSSHEVQLTYAQTDYQSSVFVYAVAPAQGHIYVFRTSNLLNTPVPVTCSLET